MSRAVMNPERKKAVLLSCVLVCMAACTKLLRGYPVWTGCWIAVMVVLMVWAMAMLAKAKR